MLRLTLSRADEKDGTQDDQDQQQTAAARSKPVPLPCDLMLRQFLDGGLSVRQVETGQRDRTFVANGPPQPRHLRAPYALPRGQRVKGWTARPSSQGVVMVTRPCRKGRGHFDQRPYSGSARIARAPRLGGSVRGWSGGVRHGRKVLLPARRQQSAAGRLVLASDGG